MKSYRILTATIAAVLIVMTAPLALRAWAVWRAPSADDRYQTAVVSRGDVISAIAANGTLNPVSIVSVGTQVSGIISRIYVDYNDNVVSGQLLAELDPAVYQAEVSQSRATVASARASLFLARTTERRNRGLFEMDLVTRQELDEAVQRRVAAEAQVAVAEGQLARDTSNLGYTRVFAPISGVVLSREVSVGQTVAASFQTPTLFKIAEDPSKMQIECNVAEADIGSVRVGQRVKFTVDAFPGKEFTGTLRQVRLDPKVDQGFVTYIVIVNAENSGGELMPGMTALVNIILNERRNVLRVPAVALAFRPTTPLSGLAEGDTKGEHQKTVYALEGKRLMPVPVLAGLSDGEYVEIRSNKLHLGMIVATAEKTTPMKVPQL